MTAPREFKTWKTVKLGTHQSVKDLSQAITNNGFKICSFAKEILKRTMLAQTETEIELVLVTAAELGLTTPTNREVLYNRANELGLDLVPAEVGPQLRCQYPDQPMGEQISVAMEPIIAAGDFGLFSVDNNPDGPVPDEEGKGLHWDCGDPSYRRLPDQQWVFGRHKQI